MKYLALLLLFLLPALCRGQIITTVAGNGIAGYSGDGGSAIDAQINGPLGIAFDRAGNLYIVQGSVLRKVNTSGIITSVAGDDTAGYSGDGGPATAAKLDGAVSTAVDSLGNIYIAEWGSERIRKINSAGIITTIAGDGMFGYNGDGISATAAKLNYPNGVTVDNLGNIYFGDIDNHRIRKISNSGIITTIAGNGIAGFRGDGGPATAAEIDYPCYLAISRSGNIYFTDWPNQCIRKIDRYGIITLVAGRGTDSTDGVMATTAYLKHPVGIAVDDSENIIFAEQENKVRKITAAGIIYTIAGISTPGFSGDGGPATLAQLYRPHEVAFDALGNLYISDNINNRIRRINYNVHGALIAEEMSRWTFSVFPNPTTHLLNIDGEELTIYSLHNIVGAQVQQGALHTGHNSINTSALPAGIYLLEVTNRQGQRTITRVVKE